MLTIVLWKWNRPGYRTTFTGAHVNSLARQIARHYVCPSRVVCVTDDPTGIDGAIDCIHDDFDFDDIPSPMGGNAPTCYRRLRLFRPDAGRWFGDRFVSLDLDTTLHGDMRPVWDRPEDFVIYDDPLYPGKQYCGAMLMMRAGARPQVWNDFDPVQSPAQARAAGKRGSDQAWISYKLPGEATWGPQDGVYSYRKHVAGGTIPADARAVMWHGQVKPWDAIANSCP